MQTLAKHGRPSPDLFPRLRAALSLWSVRGLIAVFLLGVLLALLSILDGRRFQEETTRIETARLRQRSLDEVAEAVLALERRLADDLRAAGGNPYALEVQSLRERIKLLAGAFGAEIDAKVGQLAAAVERVEAVGRASVPGAQTSAAELGKLGETLENRWLILRTAVRESVARDHQVQVKGIQERERTRGWILAIVCGAALAVVIMVVWFAGEGLLRASDQVRALTAGTVVAPLADGCRGELQGLRQDLGEIATALAAGEERRSAEKHRRERLLQRFQTAIAAIAAGNFSHPLPTGEDTEWKGIATLLKKIADELCLREEQGLAERARIQDHVLVPREEIYQLHLLFDIAPGKQTSAAELFGRQSPLRDVARRIAVLSEHQRLLVEQGRESALKVLEHSGTLSAAVQEREADFRRESRLIHETSTTVNEVSVAARQTAQMVEFVFRSAQEAMQAAEKGREQVRRSIESMSLITRRVNQIAEQILQLSGKSQEIGNIVRVISDLSKQTNLLALNAAIEAAGAGEHGKGFAVVAKEIRELAVKSSRSTQDIQQLINDIQTATNSAVLSTEDGSKSVQSGVRLVNAVNQAFNQVIEKFQEVVESAQQISTAAQEQTAGARQVAHSISTIDQMVRTTVEDLQGLRQTIEDYQGVTRVFSDGIGKAAGGDPTP